MSGFSKITIIYNPNSTGSSQQVAKDFAAQFNDTNLANLIDVLPTAYAGHAEELAYHAANQTKQPLILASGGDGSYHEVINGVFRACTEGSAAVSGLLPAGNANDHYHSLHENELKQQVLEGNYRTIDLLQIVISHSVKPWQRYAHSYIGIGLTSQAARQLAKTKLNAFNQIIIALKSIHRTRSVRIIVGGKKRRYDSLVFANIPRMSRLLTLSKDSAPDDGLFEIMAVPHKSKPHLVYALTKAAIAQADNTHQTDYYSFQTISPITVQLDGEVCPLPAGCQVDITIKPRALRCLV